MTNENMRRNDKAWAFIGGTLVGMGPTVALLPEWSAIWQTPTFTGLGMSVVGGVVGAVFVRSNIWTKVKEEVSGNGEVKP